MTGDSGGVLDDLLAGPAGGSWAPTRAHLLARSGGRPLVLFGAGGLGRLCLAHLRRVGIPPLAFADNSPARWGTQLDGLPVLEPAEAARRHGRSAAFVVTIWNPTHRYVETRDQLAALGCDLVLPVSAVPWAEYDADPSYFWRDLPGTVYAQADGVRRAWRLWGEEESRQEYLRQVRWRVRGDFDGLSTPAGGDAYFPDDLFTLAADESFVDCGAYDGCTVQSFLRHSGSAFRRVTALEPDPANFARLERSVAGLPESVRGRIDVYPYAAGASREVLRFEGTGTMSSAVTPHGSLEVQAVPLDELLAGEPPTFIKMDIEGAEPDALAGARGLIGRHHPLLAVCLYHRPEQLWTLPLLIHETYPGYRLFLRVHECDGRGLVCYAVPPGRLRR